jgi:heme A synthase
MHEVSTLKTQQRSLPAPFYWRPTFEQFAFATIALTYGLIVLGGAVRATDSGTACPDWPLCHGQVLPRIEGHVLVEYSHRLVASIVGVLIFATAVWAWRRHRDDGLVTGLAVLAVALLVAQVLVGAATVNTETEASVVAMHLSIALTLFATLIILTIAAERAGSSQREGIPLFAALVAVSAFALIITGAYVSQEGAGLVYPDWPLFDGKLVSSGGRLADLHYAHRLLAGGLGILLVALTVRMWRPETPAVARGALVIALVVYSAQVLVGAANIWFELATSLQIAHLALASALWGVLVFATAWSHLRSGGGPS